MLLRQNVDSGQSPVDYQGVQQQPPHDEAISHQLANGRMQFQYQQQQAVMMRPESLELQYGTSGYGSMDSAASQQQFRQQQQRAAQPQASMLAQQYAVINRNQQSAMTGAHLLAHNQQQRRNGNSLAVSETSGGTTPTPLYDMNQLSPRSVESTESGQSRGMYGQPRPSQPPPAPPPPPTMDGQRGLQQAHTNGDLPNRLAELQLSGRIATGGRDNTPPPPPPPSFGAAGGADRSVSPELPPPPPPLTSTGLDYSMSSEFSDKAPSPPPPLVTPASSSSFVTASSPPSNIGGGSNRLQNGAQAPPPPPPPPPPPKSDEKIPGAVAPSAPAAARSNPLGDTRTQDARSDLLRAIKQGIQLKKVDRQEEKARDDAAVEKGHDVAAILKRRMEDVMGRGSESEGSASDFEDDWDD